MSSWLQQMCFLNFASAVREAILCKDLGVERFSNISNSELYNKIDSCIVKDTDSAPKSYHVCLGWPWCSGNTQLAEPVWTPNNNQQENKHKKDFMAFNKLQCSLGTLQIAWWLVLLVSPTASTESFSSMRLGFLMIFDSRLHMRAASGNVTFITTRSCRMTFEWQKASLHSLSKWCHRRRMQAVHFTRTSRQRLKLPSLPKT